MPIQPTQADLDDYERRMELMRQKKPVYWGPDANAYSYERHVREEQEAQRRREIEFRRQQEEKRARALALAQQQQQPARARALAQQQQQPDYEMEAALMERLSMPAPARPGTTPQEEADYQARQETTRQGDPIVWGPQTPDYARHVQDEQNAQALRELEFSRQQRQRIGPDVPGQQERHRENLSQFDGQPAEQSGNAGSMSVPSGPASQPSRLRAMQNRDPVFEALVGLRDRLRNELRVDGNGDSDVTRRFQQSMADQPEPTWKSPEEKMYDTHTAMQRALSGRNTDAREARRGYRPPSEDFSNERIARGLRQRLTGQVDELSNADGRLGAMQAANDRTRAKEQDDLAANLAGFRQMRAMLDARAEEAKEAGLPNPTGTPIGGRRVKRTGDGERGDMSVGLMRRLAVREREQARSNAVNEARTAAQTGKDYEYKPTGNAANDRYAQAAASNVNSREVTRQAMLRDQLLARDDATGGKLGIRKAMQGQAAEEQRLKNSLLAQEKANEYTSSQNELDRQNELEKARIMAGGRGGNEPNVTAIRSAMDAASVTLMKPDATTDEVAEAKRIISEGQRALNGAAGIPNAPTIRPKTVEEEQAEASQNNARTRVTTSKTPDVAARNALQALDAGTLTEAQAFAEAGKYGSQAVQRLRELLDDRRNITDVRSAVGGMY